MKRKWLLSVCFSLLIFAGLLPNMANASSALYMEVDIGFSNYVKNEQPTSMTVTITNNGDTFSGDFVVDSQVSYQSGAGLVYPLDIATGETKTLQIYLDGFSDYYMYSSPQPDIFHFYEGGIEKGKKVKFEGDRKLTPRMLDPMSSIVLIATTNEDRVLRMETISTYSTNGVEEFFVTSKNHPFLAEDVRGIAAVDLIVFDDIAIQDLSEKKQQVLMEWVKKGGKIVLSSKQMEMNGAGPFAQYAPLEFTNEKVAISPDQLKKYVTTNSLNEDLYFSKAKLNAGAKAALIIDKTVIAGAMNVGEGEIIQTAFDFNDPKITALTGYGRLLLDSFRLDTNTYNMAKMPFGYATEWVYNNELFDSFRVSSVLLIVGLAGYIVIIGPVLYMLLKRKDRREKIWLFVPIIAIVTSLLFFVFGAKDRLLSPQIQQMAMYQLNDEGTIKGSYTNALLTNKAGDFSFKIAENATAMAMTADSNGEIHQKSYIKELADGKEVTLRNLGYWTVESIVGEAKLQEEGTLIEQLTLANGKITGTITNTLPIDLKDVMILTSREELLVGDIAAGETVKVNIEFKKNYLPKAAYFDQYIYNVSPDQLFDQKKNNLKSAAINTFYEHNGPLLVGWTDVALVPAKLDGVSKIEAMSYFAKAIQPNVEVSGEVVLSESEMVPFMEPIDQNSWGHIEENNIKRTYMSEGNFKVTYELIKLEELKNIKWSNLEIEYDDKQLDVEIWNYKTQMHEALAKGEWSTKENIMDYLSDDMVLEFKVTRFGVDDGEFIELPSFELKGVPAQ